MTSRWEQEYRRKLVSAEEAAAAIQPGDLVVVPVGTDPQTVMIALFRRAPDLRNVRLRLYNGLNDIPWFDPEVSDHIQPEVWFVVGPYVREQMQARRGDMAIGACTLSVKGSTDGRTDFRKPDVLLLELSPPDDEGMCSFGAVRWDKKELAQHARTIIAEVSPSHVRTHGDNSLHVSKVDYFVEQAIPPTPLRPPIDQEVQRKDAALFKAIAGHVGLFIKNGDTILMGAGGTVEPLPLFGLFDGKEDLGWHTERMPRGALRLMRERPGLFTGKRKTLDRGKHIMTLLALTEGDAAYAHMHPQIEMRSVHYVNDIRVIAAQENLVAIMNALAIDLTGQVASEHLGATPYAGPGGQPEIAIGSVLARGGRSIMVLPTRARGGAASRIVPQLETGSVVTVTRAFVDYVVTEYGIARLMGKSARQRAQELIAIAHPDHRAELTAAARRLFWP
jgi:4-hydroxybutyrate CoA-transferase